MILLLYALATNELTFLHYIMCFIFDGSFFKFPFLAGIEIFFENKLKQGLLFWAL